MLTRKAIFAVAISFAATISAAAAPAQANQGTIYNEINHKVRIDFVDTKGTRWFYVGPKGHVRIPDPIGKRSMVQAVGDTIGVRYCVAQIQPRGRTGDLVIIPLSGERCELRLR